MYSFNVAAISVQLSASLSSCFMYYFLMQIKWMNERIMSSAMRQEYYIYYII